jgi:hypothetical protein
VRAADGRATPPIRLLALDLDGTLVGADLTVSPRVQEAVTAAREQGVLVVIATGRMYRSALRFARLLQLPGPIVCYQGAYIRGVHTSDDGGGALVYSRPMRAWVAREAITWCRERGFDPHLNIDDRLVMQEGDIGANDYERLLGIGAEFVPDLLRAARRPPTKVLAVGAPGRPEAVMEEARERFAGHAQVTVSHPEYLEFNEVGVTKGRALRWLARSRSIPMSEVMAIGDQYNDLEMLAAAGHGVAMGTAPDPVRAAARWATETVAADGAAIAIEALILGTGARLAPGGTTRRRARAA